MHHRNIKDLSIALEALTRVPDSTDEMHRIRDLIRDHLTELERQKDPPRYVKLDEEITF